MTHSKQNLPLWKHILLWNHAHEHREKRYGVVTVLVPILIWGVALGYLTLAKPAYTSKWTLNLPGTGVNSSVNLDDIGTASTSSASSYSSHTISPISNYKQLSESSSLLELAAKKIYLDKEEFGKPRISLVDQTTMIFFEIKGRTAKEAQQKAFAFYEALEETLNNLRQDEIKRREEGVKTMLFAAREKLKKARDALLAYQSTSKIVSLEQFNQFALSLENAKFKLSELETDQANLMGERNQLIKSLNLTAQEASYALILQADAIFMENSKHYAQASAVLAKQLLKMDENHPEVLKNRNEVDAAKQKMVERIKQLFKKNNPDLLNRLMLSYDGALATLFEKLITIDAASQGNADRIIELKKQIADMANRLDKDMKSAAILDDLKRNHQIAEAVFSSALAKIDTGKSDIYASYPLIQMLTPPNLPEKPTSPNKMFVLIGAVGGTIFSIIGILILWSRQKYLRKILLNE